MTLSNWHDERRLVPRWRGLADTMKAGELAHPSSEKRSAAADVSIELSLMLERWHLAPDLHASADLIEQALVDGREDRAVDAARLLLSADSSAAPLIRQQAADVLRRAGKGEEIPDRFPDSGEIVRRSPRPPTRIHPNDPLRWVELAFHQTVRGHLDAAERSMTVARGLAPDNRHVLRSAARLLLHREKREEAHDLLARSPATRTDPWLQAAEIAMADLADRDPRFMKAGLSSLDRGLLPKQATELAGAIGTIELLEGSRRKARKHFALSMMDPTGNALAQGEWAARRLGSELVPTELLERTFEHWEAQAFHMYHQFRFDLVPDLCEKWAEIDAYSTKPFVFAAGAAGQADDAATALDFAERGLKRKSDSFLLLNSFAFAAATLNRLEPAAEALRKARLHKYDDLGACLLNANTGLLAFRAGLPDRARSFYESAIEGFIRLRQPEMSASARIYLAREAVLANQPDADRLVLLAKEAMKNHPRNENLLILRKVEAQIGIEQTPLPSDLPRLIEIQPAKKEPEQPVDATPTKPDFSKLRFTFISNPKLIR